MAQNRVDVILVGHDKNLSPTLNRAAANATKLSKALDAQGRAWKRTGQTMQSVGSSLTRYISIPLAAVGAASVIYAYKYEKAMMKVAGINRQSAKDMLLYRKEMDKLAASTGRGPAELADALYFVTSTGFKGAQAMDILEVSAKGAAVGMGEAQVIADSLTTALAAYEGTGLTAARAMDILTAAIRTGKAEPAEFAARIGDVAANAAHLKVEFEEVAAAIAVMTAKGINTAEAVTSINNLMLGLTKGTKAGADYLDAHGSSYYKLREILGDKGIIPALKEIKRLSDLSGFKKTDETLKTIIPNIRSLRAVWGLLGGDGTRLKRVFKEVDKSAGEAAGTFAIWAKTDVGRIQRAWATLLTGLKNIGVELLPGLARLVEKLGGVGAAFTRLSGPNKDFVIQLGLIAALTGPAVWILGSLVSSVGSLALAFAKVNRGAVGFAKMSGAIKAAFIGGAAFAPQRLGNAAAGAAGLSTTATALNAVSRAAGGARAGFASIGKAILGILGPIGTTVAAIVGIGLAIYGITKLSDALDGTTSRIGKMRKAAKAVEADDAIKKWADRQFGGHLAAQGTNGFKFVLKPEIQEPTSLLANWTRTAQAEARVVERQNNQRRRVESAEGLKAFLEQQIHEQQERLQMGGARIAGPMREQAVKAGNAYIASLREQIRGVDAIIAEQAQRTKSMGTINQGIVVKAKVDDAKARIKELQDQVAKWEKQPVKSKELILKIANAKSSIEQLTAYINQLTAKNKEVLVSLNIHQLEVQKRKVLAAMAYINKQSITPKVQLKIDDFNTKIKAAGKELAVYRSGGRNVLVHFKGNVTDLEGKMKAAKTGRDNLIKTTVSVKFKAAWEALKNDLTAINTRLKHTGNQKVTPKVLSGGMTGALSTATAINGQLTMLATRPPIHTDVTVHYSSTGTTAEKTALGALVTSPEVRLVGEAGPELILPLSNKARTASLMQHAGLSPAGSTEGGTRQSLTGVARGAASTGTRVAAAAAGAISHALGGLKKKNTAKLTNAADASSAIQTLVDFIAGITTALEALNTVTVPKLVSDWKKKIRAIVRLAVSVSTFIAAELNKAFPWTKGKKGKGDESDIEPKMGKRGTAASRAADSSGPVQTLVDFVSSIITTFAELDATKLEAGLAGLRLVVTKAAEIAQVTKDIALAVSRAFASDAKTKGGGNFTELISTAASNAVQMASDLIGIITSFADVTDEGITKSLAGMKATANALIGTELLALIVDIATRFGAAFKDTKVEDAVTAASSAAAALISDLVGILGSFAETTDKSIAKSIAGMDAVIIAMPALSAGVIRIVNAVREAFKNTKVEATLTETSSAVAGIVGDITGMISSLGDMTIDAVKKGIGGMATVTYYAKTLGVYINLMLKALQTSLGQIDVSSLAGLQEMLAILSDISSRISQIVNDLAAMTTEQLTAANAAGAALGQGFLTGLTSMYEAIIAESRRIAADSAAALGNATGASGARTAFAGGASGGAQAPSKTVVTDNSRIVINLPPGLSPAQASNIARSEINAFAARKVAASGATQRGRVRS